MPSPHSSAAIASALRLADRLSFELRLSGFSSSLPSEFLSFSAAASFVWIASSFSCGVCDNCPSAAATAFVDVDSTGVVYVLP